MTSQKKSKWSLALSIIGVIVFSVSYLLSENPTYIEKLVIGILYFSGIVLMIGGIISGVWAFKTMEKGVLKYLGLSVIILLVIILALPLFFMALFGFGG